MLIVPGPFTAFDKGEEVQVVGGKYLDDARVKHAYRVRFHSGSTITKRKKHPSQQCWIIFDLGDEGEIATCIEKKYVIPLPGRPKGAFEAARKTFPKLEQRVIQLCDFMAACEISPDDPKVTMYIHEKRVEAYNRQKEKGAKAKYYKVCSFDSSDGEDENMQH